MTRPQLGLLSSVYLMVFTALLDLNIVVVAVPTMQVAVHLSAASAEWVVGAYPLCLSTLALSAGAIGDRYGRKRVYLIGVGLFVIGSSICAVAATPALLVTGRFVQGTGAAVAVPSTLSLIAHGIADSAKRANAIGGWATVTGLAGVAGPVVGGCVVDRFGWPGIFLLGVPLGLIALLAGMLWIDESTISRGSGLDPGGQILAVSWLGTLSYGLIQVADHGWTNPIVVGLLIFSLAALTLFIAVELRQRHPMLEIRLFVNLPFAVSTFAAAALGFSAFSMLFFLPTFLQRVQHYSALGAGLLLLPLPISTMLAGGIAGRWCARAGRPWVPMLTGLVLLTTALMGLLAVRSSDTSTILVPLLVFLGLGGGLTLATTNIAALAATSSAATGTASAILLAIRQTGNLLGIALLGALLATRVTADLGGSHDLQPLAESTRHFNELPLGRSTAMATLVRPVDPASGFANPSLDRSSPLRYSTNQFAEAYTSGLHIAALAAAGFTFAATLLTVVFIRRSSGAKQEKGRVDGRVSAI